jgi:hypothetical protein
MPAARQGNAGPHRWHWLVAAELEARFWPGFSRINKVEAPVMDAVPGPDLLPGTLFAYSHGKG